MLSFRELATGRVYGCFETYGIFIFTAKRHSSWSTVASEVYFEHFWNDFAADPKHSVPEADRRFYADAYAQPGAMRAGFEVFRAFEKDAKDFADFAQTKLTMPMLVLTGEKASGQFLIDQARLVDTNVEGVVIKGSGHWLMEERPKETIDALTGFLSK